MKKSILSIIVLLVLFNYTVAAYDNKCYYDFNSFKTILFCDNNQVEFCDEANSMTDKLWNQKFHYDFISENVFCYINLYQENFVDSFLILLSDDLLVLYRTDREVPVFFGTSEGSNQKEFYSFPVNISASSELTEKNIIYKAENLSNLEGSYPWAENATGDGINETISFEGNFEHLFIFSGFVSAKRPYLYTQNARAKKLLVCLKDKNDFFEIILEDSPNPQRIDLQQRYSGTIELKITDSYPGCKYQDLCINAIIGRY